MLAKWSDLYEVVGARGVVISLRDPKTKQMLYVHSDRLSNVNRHLREEPKEAVYSDSHYTPFENDPIMPKLDENPPDSDSPDLQFLDHERALPNRVPRKIHSEDYEYNLFDTLYLIIEISPIPHVLGD